MQTFFDSSQILIVDDINESLDEILKSYPKHSIRVIKNEEKDEFQLLQAQNAIKEAYIASSEKKYLFLCGSSFRVEAQNSLLKILEEPPTNIVFIILTTLKSSLLPTIYSRIPFKILKKSNQEIESSFDFRKLDLKDIYSFLKDNQRVGKNEAKEFLESFLVKIKNQNIKLDEKELELFSSSIKLLELNSRPINILTTVLLALLNKKS